MPHERKRHALLVLEHLAKVSPLVGLLGHRQVGKTTLLERLSGKYLSFDDDSLLRLANENPKEFLSELKTLKTAIDECQLSPNIFPALKERVRLNKRPGQFYLSGSVRFTSKKAIRESLTGRIMYTELLPLTLSELDRKDLPEVALRNSQVSRFDNSLFPKLTTREHDRRMKLVRSYFRQGGLPGVCFLRSDKLREQRIIDQLETIFNRDLRQVQPTTLVSKEIFDFVRALAVFDGELINHQELKRRTAITPITQKKLLFALEATFVLRFIRCEGDYRGYAVFFEDQAESLVLSQNQISDERQWEGLIYRNLREQFTYRIGENADFFQYRTRSGVRVPIVIRTSNSVLGIIPVQGEASRSAQAAAHSFLGKYANSKVLLVTNENETHVMDERTAIVPASALLF